MSARVNTSLARWLGAVATLGAWLSISACAGQIGGPDASRDGPGGSESAGTPVAGCSFDVQYMAQVDTEAPGAASPEEAVETATRLAGPTLDYDRLVVKDGESVDMFKGPERVGQAILYRTARGGWGVVEFAFCSQQ